MLQGTRSVCVLFCVCVCVCAHLPLPEGMAVQVLAHIRGYADAAQEPQNFPTSPALVVPAALAKAQMQQSDIDFWEINQAFSVVDLVNQQLLGLDPSRYAACWGLGPTHLPQLLISYLRRSCPLVCPLVCPSASQQNCPMVSVISQKGCHYPFR